MSSGVKGSGLKKKKEELVATVSRLSWSESKYSSSGKIQQLQCLLLLLVMEELKLLLS